MEHANPLEFIVKAVCIVIAFALFLGLISWLKSIDKVLYLIHFKLDEISKKMGKK